jgi:hypothetical protein
MRLTRLKRRLILWWYLGPPRPPRGELEWMLAQSQWRERSCRRRALFQIGWACLMSSWATGDVLYFCASWTHEAVGLVLVGFAVIVAWDFEIAMKTAQGILRERELQERIRWWRCVSSRLNRTPLNGTPGEPDI